MTVMRNTIALAIAVIGLACAASIPEATKEELAKPIDCDTAEGDIARLEAERANVGKQISSGVRSVAPPAVIAGIVRGDTKDRARVASGAYNQEIERKIFQIRQQCAIPGALVTKDGLYQFEHARVGFAAMKPGVSLGVYNELIILPVYIAFQEGSRELPEHRVDLLRRLFHEAFTKELEEKGGYHIVSEPHPNVLLVRPALVNILVSVPEESMSARDSVYISSAGQLTLIAEFRDSMTGELLARAADRRAITEPGNVMYESNPVSNQANVRREFRRWASLLREHLDSSAELEAARN